MKNKLGFTLIELLVVIAILAGMVAILFPNFMDVRERARDNQRKADLKNYQKALEFYKDNQNPPKYAPDASFPLPCANWTVSGFQYMAKTPGERIAAVESLRRQQHGSSERLQRTARVIQRP